MSVDLNIRLVKPIPIHVMEPKIGAAVEEILGLSFASVIAAEELVNGVRGPLRSEMISGEPRGILFRITNEPEVASVGTYVIEHPLLTDEEQGTYVYVNVSFERSALEYALAAAVAATFARELGTVVIDNRAFYTDALTQPADIFVDAIKVCGTFDDYRVAAKVFYDALPKVRPRGG